MKRKKGKKKRCDFIHILTNIFKEVFSLAKQTKKFRIGIFQLKKKMILLFTTAFRSTTELHMKLINDINYPLYSSKNSQAKIIFFF